MSNKIQNPNFKILKVQKEQAFTLIEVMIAIFVMIVGVVGIYGLVPHIFGVVAVNNDRFVASQLAKEGIEIIRNIRDVNYLDSVSDWSNAWNEGLDNCATLSGGCEADYLDSANLDPSLPIFSNRELWVDETTGLFSYTVAGENSRFQRKIMIDSCGPECLDVQVLVSWPKNTYFSNEITSLKAEEKLYNWR